MNHTRMVESNESIAERLAQSAYHYPPQDNELGFNNAKNLILSELYKKDAVIGRMRAVVEAAKNYVKPRVCCHWNPETEEREKKQCLHPLIDAISALEAVEDK